MLACWYFKAVDYDEQQRNGNNKDDVTHISHKIIEKVIKKFRRHRTTDNVNPRWIKINYRRKGSNSSSKKIKRMTT